MTIKFAVYYEKGEGDRALAQEELDTGKLVAVTGMSADMEGHVYCPQCGHTIFRSPKLGNQNSTRPPYFSHKKDVNHKCELKSEARYTRRYKLECDALKDIVNNRLVVIHGFSDDKRSLESDYVGKHYVEAKPDTKRMVKLGKDDSVDKVFSLPSTMTSMTTVCRNFDLNLNRFFVLPDGQVAKKLFALLANVNKVSETTSRKGFYFGRIIKVESGGNQQDNVLNFHLEYSEREGLIDEKEATINDFTLRTTNSIADQIGLHQNVIGRYLIMYSDIRGRGRGLSVRESKSSEVALLPQKYDHLLDAL